MIVSAILGLIRKQCTSGGNPKSGLDRPLMPTAHCPMGSRCSASAAAGGTTEHTKNGNQGKRKSHREDISSQRLLTLAMAYRSLKSACKSSIYS